MRGVNTPEEWSPQDADLAAACQPLAQVLFAQGFGARRLCAGLLQHGRVWVRFGPHGPWTAAPSDAQHCYTLAQVQHGLWIKAIDAGAGLDLGWPVVAKAQVVMHKPAGFECSQRASAWPSVYTLLPAPLRQRPVRGGTDGVQAAGRLDQDTTGLLLLSDDGPWLHRLASPKHHATKVYQVGLQAPASDADLHAMLGGMQLPGERSAWHAVACERVAADDLGAYRVQMTLAEGKYHQVKRMWAARGHTVVRLHRSQMGALTLPADLAPGQWRWLSATQVAQCSASMRLRI
jgi:16S rRNA pseudouridine516 synthase